MGLHGWLEELMTRETAIRLARGLIEINSTHEDFDFELDTASNTNLLAVELEGLGCGVERLGDTRMNVRLPLCNRPVICEGTNSTQCGPNQHATP